MYGILYRHRILIKGLGEMAKKWDRKLLFLLNRMISLWRSDKTKALDEGQCIVGQ